MRGLENRPDESFFARGGITPTAHHSDSSPDTDVYPSQTTDALGSVSVGGAASRFAHSAPFPLPRQHLQRLPARR